MLAQAEIIFPGHAGVFPMSAYQEQTPMTGASTLEKSSMTKLLFAAPVIAAVLLTGSVSAAPAPASAPAASTAKTTHAKHHHHKKAAPAVKPAA